MDLAKISLSGLAIAPGTASNLPTQLAGPGQAFASLLSLEGTEPQSTALSIDALASMPGVIGASTDPTANAEPTPGHDAALIAADCLLACEILPPGGMILPVLTESPTVPAKPASHPSFDLLPSNPERANAPARLTARPQSMVGGDMIQPPIGELAAADAAVVSAAVERVAAAIAERRSPAEAKIVQAASNGPFAASAEVEPAGLATPPSEWRIALRVAIQPDAASAAPKTPIPAAAGQVASLTPTSGVSSDAARGMPDLFSASIKPVGTETSGTAQPISAPRTAAGDLIQPPMPPVGAPTAVSSNPAPSPVFAKPNSVPANDAAFAALQANTDVGQATARSKPAVLPAVTASEEKILVHSSTGSPPEAAPAAAMPAAPVSPEGAAPIAAGARRIEPTGPDLARQIAEVSAALTEADRAGTDLKAKLKFEHDVFGPVAIQLARTANSALDVKVEGALPEMRTIAVPAAEPRQASTETGNSTASGAGQRSETGETTYGHGRENEPRSRLEKRWNGASQQPESNERAGEGRDGGTRRRGIFA